MRVLYLTMNPNRESTTVPTEGWFRLLRDRGLEPVLVSNTSGAFQAWAHEQGIRNASFQVADAHAYRGEVDRALLLDGASLRVHLLERGQGGLRQGVAAAEVPHAVLIGAANRRVHVGPCLLHPGQQRGAEVEADAAVVVAQRGDVALRIEKPRHGIGGVALGGGAPPGPPAGAGPELAPCAGPLRATPARRVLRRPADCYAGPPTATPARRLLRRPADCYAGPPTATPARRLLRRAADCYAGPPTATRLARDS